jgi:hypothetical protein
MNLIKKQNFLLIAYTAKCIDVGKVCQMFFYRYYMSSFTENLYLKRQIQKLQEENQQLKYALQEAGIEGILRPLFGGGAVQSAAKALRKKKPTQTTQPPSQPPSQTPSPKPKVPGEFGHGYNQTPLIPGQVLPTNIPPQTPDMGTFRGKGY